MTNSMWILDCSYLRLLYTVHSFHTYNITHYKYPGTISKSEFHTCQETHLVKLYTAQWLKHGYICHILLLLMIYSHPHNIYPWTILIHVLILLKGTWGFNELTLSGGTDCKCKSDGRGPVKLSAEAFNLRWIWSGKIRQVECIPAGTTCYCTI